MIIVVLLGKFELELPIDLENVYFAFSVIALVLLFMGPSTNNKLQCVHSCLPEVVADVPNSYTVFCHQQLMIQLWFNINVCAMALTVFQHLSLVFTLLTPVIGM